MLKFVFLIWILSLAVSERFNEFHPPHLFECEADKIEPWTHRGENGPVHWGKKYPECKGMKQSPIDIETRFVVEDDHLEELIFQKYDHPLDGAKIENNGRTVMVQVNDDIKRSIHIKDDVFSLVQLHFHWGSFPYTGSEHSIDGTHYPMEMHLVHSSADRRHAVVAIFLQLNKTEENPALQPIVDQLHSVQYKDKTSKLRLKFVLHDLLPRNQTFFRYEGSLTTPGCDEGVTWSILREPMTIGTKQMIRFTELYSVTAEHVGPPCHISGNYRPQQPLNGRTVYVSKDSGN